MKRMILLILTGVLLLSACGPEKGIEVHSAWARPAGQGENGALYFEIRNLSSMPDVLTGASSDAAQTVEIHESKLSGDVMQMDMISTLPLEPYANVAFEPGGLHIMLVNLKEELKLDDEIEVVLLFKNHQDITVHVVVNDAAPKNEDHDDM